MSTPYQQFADARTQKNYGCDYEEAVRLNGGLGLRTEGSFARRYQEHRFNAKQRDVGWEITFPEWVEVWVKSGRWEQRGTSRGQYSMARHGDVGPYRVDNVSIQLSVDNTSFALGRAPRQSKRNRTGKGRGWTLHKGRYCAQFCGKVIGRFGTQEEAEAAYRAAVSERHVNRSVDGVTE